MNNLRLQLGVLLLLTVGFGLAGCGGGDDSESGSGDGDRVSVSSSDGEKKTRRAKTMLVTIDGHEVKASLSTAPSIRQFEGSPAVMGVMGGYVDVAAASSGDEQRAKNSFGVFQSDLRFNGTLPGTFELVSAEQLDGGDGRAYVEIKELEQAGIPSALTSQSGTLEVSTLAQTESEYGPSKTQKLMLTFEGTFVDGDGHPKPVTGEIEYEARQRD